MSFFAIKIITKNQSLKKVLKKFENWQKKSSFYLLKVSFLKTVRRFTFIMVMGYFYSFSGFSDLSKICLRLPITQVIRL